MYHPVSFEGHVGELFIYSGKVEFYNTMFDNISQAVKILSRLPVGIKYSPFYCGSLHGIKIETGGVMLLLSDKETTRWFLNEDDVRRFYLKMMDNNTY